MERKKEGEQKCTVHPAGCVHIVRLTFGRVIPSKTLLGPLYLDDLKGVKKELINRGYFIVLCLPLVQFYCKSGTGSAVYRGVLSTRAEQLNRYQTANC